MVHHHDAIGFGSGLIAAISAAPASQPFLATLATGAIGAAVGAVAIRLVNEGINWAIRKWNARKPKP